MAQASISSYPVSYTTSGSLSGTNYRNAIGKGADTSAVSGNDYCSSRNSYAHIYYAFDFSEIPNGANIVSVKCQVKGHAENTSQSTERARCQLYAGTSTEKGNYSDFTSTSAQTLTLTTGTWTYDEVQDMRLCFTVGYYGGLVNGATVTVTYEVANPRTITTTLTGNGTIEPNGTTTTYDGEEFELIITPTNSSDTVTATLNGTSITSQLERHTGTETESQVPTEDFTTGFSSSDAAFYQSSSTSGTSWLEYAIGYSAESPYSTSNTSNTYVKPEGATGWINYQFDFSAIPTSATITNVSVKVYGARENATVDSSHVARFQCYSGSTAKGTIQNFTSTSNSLVTVSDVGTWTAAELHNAQLRFEVGYYGGRMLGITWSVTYTAKDHYTYTYTVSGNATIAVTIGSSGSQSKVFIKQNDSWVQYSKIYKKVNDSWVEQSSSDWDTVLPAGSDYRIIEL